MHIDRLAWRDEDYTRRKYGLSPDQLIEGAVKLAVLFAGRPALSLAPTQTEIAAEIADSDVPGGSLESMLGALVDVKIGRSDVQEARAGDRRFTFSHRRYQETLFVRHLAQTPQYLSARELLTDTRWREYTVTLLQTQDLAVIEPLLTEATDLLAEVAARAIRVPIIKEFGGHLTYYNWDADPAVFLLTLLQEGMGRRLADIPLDLSIQIEQLLEPRWKDGDIHDQMTVLQLGGLLPQALLEKHLADAVNYGRRDIEDIAFERGVFLKKMPATLATWFRERLSTEAIGAVRRADVVRLEALAARLPSDIGATFVLRRCRLIMKLRRPFKLLAEWTVLLPLTLLYRVRSTQTDYLRTVDRILPMMELCLAPYMILVIFGSHGYRQVLDTECKRYMDFQEFAPLFVKHVMSYPAEQLYLYSGLGVAYVIAMGAMMTLYRLRSVGRRIDLALLLGRLRGVRLTRTLRSWTKIVVSIFMAILACTAPGALAHGVAWLLGYRDLGFFLYLGAFVATMIGVAIILLAIDAYKQRRFRTRLRILHSQALGPALVLQARTPEELQYWLDNDKDLWGQDVAPLRSLLRLLRSSTPYKAEHPIFGLPLFRSGWSERAMHRVLGTLLKDLKHLIERA